MSNFPNPRIESIDYAHDIRPYLQLPHLLSLTWLAYPILSLIFIVFRLQLSSTSAQDAVTNAKEDLLAACKAAERAATSTASMPRYLAIASNQQITDAVNGTMNAARATMVLALTIMEVIINFVIDIYRSTLLCFLELIIRGALSVLIKAVDEANQFIHAAAGPVVDGVTSAAQGVNDAVASIVGVANKLPGVDFSVPHIDTSGLQQLKNLTLPSSITDGLQNLNSSIPTVAELKDKVESIVDTPFELLKKDINETFAGISFEVNALPLPRQNTVTFCDQMDTSVVDDLGRDLVKIVKIGTIVMIVLIFLLIAANCALEWYKWRAMKNHFALIREGMLSDPDVAKMHTTDGRLMVGMSDHDLMSIEGTMSHPMIAKLINKFELLFRMKKSWKDKMIWFFHYVFHPPALACFLIGFFGLLSVQLQLLAIGPIQHKFEKQTESSVSNFSSLIATSINASMYNDSAAYAGAVNARVDNVQSTINDGLFGWVNSTTMTLNDTVNAFYTDVQNVVNSVFGNTILNDPVQEFVRCFIGSKVDAIENALTFLHDNLHVDIPRVNDTILVLSPDSVNEATQPIAQAAIGTGNEDNTGLVGRVIAVYVKSLKQERIMFGIFLLLWLFVVFMALVILFWTSYGRGLKDKIKGQGHRGDRPDRTITPFIGSGYGSEKHAEEGSGMYEVKLSDAQDQESFAPRPNFWDTIKGPWRRDTVHAQSQSNDYLAPPHPLATRKPEFERSWDNMLDGAHLSTYSAQDGSRPTISGPFKLMALGRKMVSREPPLQDSERSSAPFVLEDQVVLPTREPWHKRWFGASKKGTISALRVDVNSTSESYRDERAEKQVSFASVTAADLVESTIVAPPPFPKPYLATPSQQDPFADPPVARQASQQPHARERPLSRPRSRPNLSISTDLAAVRPSGLPVISQTPATSGSPMAPPVKPWVDPMQPTRPIASVPQDVNSKDEGSTVVTGDAQPRAIVPLPLYYDFEQAPTRAPSQPSQYLKPPSLLPKRVDPDTSTPVTRHLTTNHARKSSQAVDPFVTPFDDEHRVQAAVTTTTTTTSSAAQTGQTGLWPRARYSVRQSNPFADRSDSGSNPFIAIAV